MKNERKIKMYSHNEEQPSVIIKIKEDQYLFQEFIKIHLKNLQELQLQSQQKKLVVGLPYVFDQEVLKAFFNVPIFFVLTKDSGIDRIYKANLNSVYNKKVDEKKFFHQFDLLLPNEKRFYTPKRFNSCVVIDSIIEIYPCDFMKLIEGAPYWCGNKNGRKFEIYNFCHTRENRCYVTYNSKYRKYN